MGSEKTYLDDIKSFHALVAAMPEASRVEYESYKATMLEAVFPGRKMIIYKLQDGKPSDIEVISFGDLTIDWDNGPACNITDTRGTMQVLTIPKQIRPREVFIQIPQHFEVKYRGRAGGKSGVDFVSHYAVLIKTRSKEIHQVESNTYCVTLNKFNERFADLKIRY
jgi:hypothetical protein